MNIELQLKKLAEDMEIGPDAEFNSGSEAVITLENGALITLQSELLHKLFSSPANLKKITELVEGGDVEISEIQFTDEMMATLEEVFSMVNER